MNETNYSKDCKTIRLYLQMSQASFSLATGVPRVTIARLETSSTTPKKQTIEAIYGFAYSKGLRLNEAKASIRDDDKKDSILLFHGAKNEIKGELDLKHSQGLNDFGPAFYAGESYEQAATWSANEINGCVYTLYFKNYSGLNGMELTADGDWMIAVLYYRGKLGEYAHHPLVTKLISSIEQCDYLIAPIANNSMYDTLAEFSNKRLTDEQTRHALSANNLGRQYVFRTEKSLKEVSLLDRLYLSEQEKVDWQNIKIANSEKGRQKVSIVIEEYRRKGLYIDELFK